MQYLFLTHDKLISSFCYKKSQFLHETCAEMVPILTNIQVGPNPIDMELEFWFNVANTKKRDPVNKIKNLACKIYRKSLILH